MASLKAHIGDCEQCKSLVEAIAALDPDDAPDSFFQNLMTGIKIVSTIALFMGLKGWFEAQDKVWKDRQIGGPPSTTGERQGPFKR